MSDERTQAPSKRRRQQARECGQVARSPELTAAVGLLAAVVLLGFRGGDLVAALIALAREPLVGAPVVSADPGQVVDRLRHLAAGVAVPLGTVLGGILVAMVAAHQVQVGGLWAPGLLAPDPGRLWGGGSGTGLAARGARGAWALGKAAFVVAVAAWTIRAHLPTFLRLGHLDPHVLARALGHLLYDLAAHLALATLALGLADFALQFFRLEALLRLTSEEQREDLRADDGDPSLRARRRRIASAWFHDPGQVVAGASLALTGPAGLTVLLAGGPPPRQASVRFAAQGAAGLRLCQAAARVKLPLVESPELARRLARRGATELPLDASFLAELATLWPPDLGPGRRPRRPGRRGD